MQNYEPNYIFFSTVFKFHKNRQVITLIPAKRYRLKYRRVLTRNLPIVLPHMVNSRNQKTKIIVDVDGLHTK